MKAFWLLILGLIIGIAVGYWFWHRRPGVNTTTVQVQGVGKQFIYAKQRDVLKFVNAQGEGQDVTFLFGSPCQGGKSTVSSCQIEAPPGFYSYKCKTCLDPGVRVGSSGGTGAIPIPKPTRGTVDTPGPVNTADPPDPFVYCDPSEGNATAQTVTARVNDQIQWFPSPEVAVKDWHIVVHGGVCKEGTTFTPPNRDEPTGVCTVLKSDSYSVQAAACRANSGTAQLTVQ